MIETLHNLGPAAPELAERYAPHILAWLRGKPSEHSLFPFCVLGQRHSQLGPYQGSEWDLKWCSCGHLWRLSELKHHVYRAMQGKANGDSTSRILRWLRSTGQVNYEATRAHGGVYRRIE